VQARLDQADQELRQREEQRQLQHQENTAAKVTLAQMEERLRGLRARRQQADADLAQCRQDQERAGQQLRAGQCRLQDSQRAMLQASGALGWWYLEKEDAQRQIGQRVLEREEQRQLRQTLVERLQAAQGAWRAQQEQAHARELAVRDLRHRRDSLADRLREDYQLELAQLYEQRLTSAAAGWQSQNLDAKAITEEIEDLKRKLSRLGSVNLDALQELAELEARAQSLQAQYDDLVAAQKSLQEIIAKINLDSRKLFSDTFVTIRGNFQELFRKLFGGGMADIILEDDADILDSGIEIVARPPGKELRSISLMSGGEKTMTAVALLLAIFRSKPGPFCILDEVDAALDEANIDRFTSVLREFLDRSHFIIVTHSKKTMSCADVLYGVTMQESGISKRVAVKLEDWPDEAPTEPAAAAAERNGH
jgi:chromosome segregation protein